MRDEIHALIEATCVLPSGWIDSSNLLKPLQRVDDAWRKKHARWLREMDAFGVYFSAVGRKVGVNNNRKDRERLVDLIGSTKAKELEDDLVEFMESLPRRYTFEFPILTPVPFGTPEIKLSKTLALVEVQRPGPATSIPLGDLMAGLVSAQPGATQITTITALRVQAVGYFDNSYEDSAA